MVEADVLDPELGLPLPLFLHPGEMRLVELLAQPGELDRIGSRKQDLIADR